MNTKYPKFFSRGQVHTFFFLFQSDTCFVCLCIYMLRCVNITHVSAHICVCLHKCVCVHICVCAYRCMWRWEVSVKYSSLPCFGPWSSLAWLDWLGSKSPISPHSSTGVANICRHAQLSMWVPGFPTQVFVLLRQCLCHSTLQKSC